MACCPSAVAPALGSGGVTRVAGVQPPAPPLPAASDDSLLRALAAEVSSDDDEDACVGPSPPKGVGHVERATGGVESARRVLEGRENAAPAAPVLKATAAPLSVRAVAVPPPARELGGLGARSVGPPAPRTGYTEPLSGIKVRERRRRRRGGRALTASTSLRALINLIDLSSVSFPHSHHRSPAPWPRPPP